jgi:hypothetical protein
MPTKDLKVFLSVAITLVVAFIPFTTESMGNIPLESYIWWTIPVSVILTALNIWAHEDTTNIFVSIAMWVLSGIGLTWFFQANGMFREFPFAEVLSGIVGLFWPLYGLATSTAAMLLRAIFKK